MKKMLYVFTMLVCSSRLVAQAQEIQQLKLDLEKLVQLKLMLSQLKDGYQTLQNGFNAVSGAAKGNLDLHKNYLDGLLTVSERVRQSPALQRIGGNQSAMQREYAQWMATIKPLRLLTDAELKEVQLGFQAIADAASQDSEQLTAVLRSKDLRMSDGERFTLIEGLAGKSDQQLNAVRSLIKEKTILLTARMRDQNELKEIKKMYGLR